MPSTIKSPLILTVPVLSPTLPGSIIRFAGPAIVAVSPPPLRTDIPIPVDVNLLVTFNDVAVSAPDTFTLSSSVCPSTSIEPLKSAAPVKVETPDTLTLSSSVCPSTSIEPLKSAAPVKVEAPDTFTSSSSV